MQIHTATMTVGRDGALKRVVAFAAALLVVAGLTAAPAQQAAAERAAHAVDAGAEQLLSVIVRAVGGADAASSAVERFDGTVTQRLGVVDGVAAEIDASTLADLTTEPGILSVTQDAAIELLAKPSVGDGSSNAATISHIRAATGSTQSERKGNDGTGIGVALIDTGVANVGGLENVLRGPNTGGGAAGDGYGHGTHLAGIIGGNDKVTSGFAGIGPDATTVSIKASADDGSTSLTSVIAALDWVVQNKASRNIRVLNLSLGVPATVSYTKDLLAAAVESVWKAGVVVVVAAGNEGEAAGSPLTSPATDPYVIAVGAARTMDTDTIADDVVAAFSPRGSAARRVDLVAPGKSVVSLKAPGSVAATSYPAALVGDRYIKGSGTSQAAAVVSGIVADLLEARPNLTPDEVKAVLRASAVQLPLGDAGQLSLIHI